MECSFGSVPVIVRDRPHEQLTTAGRERRSNRGAAGIRRRERAAATKPVPAVAGASVDARLRRAAAFAGRR
jgi:hypothetical protein